MDREMVMRIVEPLFEKEACVSRAELLACIDASDEIPEDEKHILHSLQEDCYTRESFRGALDQFGWTSPIGLGANEGGF